VNNQQTQINFDEAKAAIEQIFSGTIGTLSLNNAILQKRLAISQQTVRQLTESEVSLAMHIQELKAEITRLRQQLPLSLEAEMLAAEGREIIQADGGDGKEKAAPVEAA